MRDIKNRHQLISTANNCIGVMNAALFQHCKNKKKKPKEDASYVFNPGHVMPKCKVEKPCYHYKDKESHHRSLCPRLFKQKKPLSNSVFTANTAPPLTEDCDEGQSILAAGNK